MSIYELTWVAYIISVLIYMAVLYIYFASAFEMRYSAKVTAVAYIVIFATDFLFVPPQAGRINILINVIAFALLISLYMGNLRTRISMALFIYIVAFLSDFIAAYTILLIVAIPIAEIVFGTPEFIYGLLISRVFLAIFAKILFNITTRRKLPRLSALHWVALVVPPAGSIFVLYNFLYLRGHSVADIISSMIVVVTNFIVINVFGKILADFEASKKNEILEEQLKHYNYQSFLAQESERLIIKTKHDIQGLLIGVKADIQMNKPHNVEKRIDELLGNIDSFNGSAQSGNLAIDSIINFKADVARKRKIYFSVELAIPKNIDVDSIIICQILGNALDNAIESTEKVADHSKRIVQVYMSYLHESLFLRIINSYEGEVVTDGKGRMLSSKRGFRSEGIGLQNIRNAVADNRGDVGVTYEDAEFVLSITLYGIKANDKMHAITS